MVNLYAEYLVSKRHYHAGQKVPVGMTRNLHQAKLKQELVDAAYRHANWAARQIARYVLAGIEESKIDIPAQQYFDWLAQDKNALSRLYLYQVVEPLRDIALQTARNLVIECTTQGKLLDKPRWERNPQ